MTNVNRNLRISIILRIQPVTRERRFKDTRTDTIRIGDIAPCLFGGVKELVEIFPARHVALDEDDVGFALSEGLEVGCIAEITDEDALCAEGVALAG